MLLNVKPILHTPGKRLDFQFELDLSDMEFSGRYPIVARWLSTVKSVTLQVSWS